MTQSYITFNKTTGEILSSGDVPERDLPQETDTVGVKLTYARLFNPEAFGVRLSDREIVRKPHTA